MPLVCPPWPTSAGLEAPPFLQPGVEFSARFGSLAAVLAPFLIPFVESSERLPMSRANLALILQECPHDVHLRAVLPGGLAHFCGRLEALALPLQATLEGPAQDARELCPELLRQLLILLGWRDGLLEGNQPEAAPDRGVGSPDLRLMVDRHKDLVRGVELPKVLAHPARTHFIAAG